MMPNAHVQNQNVVKINKNMKIELNIKWWKWLPLFIEIKKSFNISWDKIIYQH